MGLGYIYGCGYMGLGYGRCLLRRRWLGRRDLQQPARIHLPFSWKWPLLDPLRGGNVPGHDSFEGQLPAWIRCQHSGAAASPGRIRVIRGSPAQMDRACSHQTDGTTPANRLLALIPCARTFSRTGYIEDPDWSHQLPRQRTFPDNSDINQHCAQPTFLMFRPKWTIFSGPQSCSRLNYWPCHPNMKRQKGSVILIG